jgi:hypothetical protein
MPKPYIDPDFLFNALMAVMKSKAPYRTKRVLARYFADRMVWEQKIFRMIANGELPEFEEEFPELSPKNKRPD